MAHRAHDEQKSVPAVQLSDLVAEQAWQCCHDTAVISNAKICMFLLHLGSCSIQAQKQRLHVDMYII